MCVISLLIQILILILYLIINAVRSDKGGSVSSAGLQIQFIIEPP